MRLGSQRSSRSVDYLLATLSPLDISRSTRAYLQSQDESDLQRLIERSLARMDDDERGYFAISPDFATFLEHNRRALRTLDRDALRAILMPVILARTAQVDGTEDESIHVDELSASLRAALPPVSAALAWHRIWDPIAGGAARAADAVYELDAAIEHAARRAFPIVARAAVGLVTACGVVAAGAAIALLLVSIVVPAGRSALAWVDKHPLPPIAFAAPAHPAPSAPVQHRHVSAAPAHHRVVALASSPHPKGTPRAASNSRPAPAPSAKPKPTPTPVVQRIAAAARPKPHVVQPPAAPTKHLTVATAATPSSDAPLVQRARLIVMSYLDSLMRGDASSALGNLGLSASAGTSNLTEAPILAGATEFRIVRASQTDSANAKVQVVIESPQGRFFGDYIVSANGPAAWITQHEVVPVETTASRHQ